MMKFILGIFLIITTFIPAYAQLDENLIDKHNIEIEKISSKKYYSKKDKKKLKHYFPLSLVHFRDTSWSKKKIMKRVKGIVNTYKKCSIGVAPIQMITMNAPFGYINLGSNSVSYIHFGTNASKDSSNDNSKANLIMKELEALVKPIVFYIQFDLDSKAPAWAHRKLFNKNQPKVDTAWMTYFSSRLEFPDQDYSIEAHELGHLLLNRGHDFSEERNLMSYEGLLNSNILTQEQCDKIKQSHLVTTKPSIL